MAELQPPQNQINGGPPVGPSTETLVVTKRQRRPSVRLGDIGDHQTTSLTTHDSLARRSKHFHDYKHKMEAIASGKGSKARTLMNFGSKSGGEVHETLDGEDNDADCDVVAVGTWKAKDLKSRRGLSKRVRSNWVPKVDDEGGGEGNNDKISGDGEDVDSDNDGYQDFEPEGSDSPIERGRNGNEMLHFHGQRRPFRATRVSEGRDEDDDVELEDPLSDMDARDWRCGTTSGDMNANNEMGRCRSSEDGVRIWLDGLGLGRYAPVFEIHEVDDEVLHMLTLEDLKDMGINAVGSRRKIFTAIQKLGKGFP